MISGERISTEDVDAVLYRSEYKVNTTIRTIHTSGVVSIQQK